MQTAAGWGRWRSAIATDDRILHRRGVFSRTVPLRAARGAQRTIADRLNSAVDHEAEQVRLLEMRVKLHLVRRRLDARLAKKKRELGDGHIGRADVPDELLVDQSLHRAPGPHEVCVNVGLRVGTARGRRRSPADGNSGTASGRGRDRDSRDAGRRATCGRTRSRPPARACRSRASR